MKQKSTKGGRMQKKQYRTIRVHEETAKDLEWIAAYLTMQDGEKHDIAQAARFATITTVTEISESQKQTAKA
jgi:hypothetical protein